MATEAEDLAERIATRSGLIAKRAEVMGDPRPNYTISGISMDFDAYYRFLSDQIAALDKEIADRTIIDNVTVAWG